MSAISAQLAAFNRESHARDNARDKINNNNHQELRELILTLIKQVEALDKKVNLIVGPPIAAFNPRVDTSTNTPPPARTVDSGTQSPFDDKDVHACEAPAISRQKTYPPIYFKEKEEEEEETVVQGHDGQHTKI